MTDKPTIDEQIDAVRQESSFLAGCDSLEMHYAVIASLEGYKRIREAEMPVEPEFIKRLIQSVADALRVNHEKRQTENPNNRQIELKGKLKMTYEKGLLRAAECRHKVAILPGEMPDAMWEKIKGDKDAVTEALRIAVRQTLDEYEAAIRAEASQPEGQPECVVVPVGDRNKTGFVADIEAAINRYSKESGSDTPDFILAEYLADCLAAFDKSVSRRTEWYAPEPKPSAALLAENEALRKDAERLNGLVAMDAVKAQAIFWNHSSRKERKKAIDNAIAGREG